MQLGERQVQIIAGIPQTANRERHWQFGSQQVDGERDGDGDGEEKGDKKRCINIVCNVKIVNTS